MVRREVRWVGLWWCLRRVAWSTVRDPGTFTRQEIGNATLLEFGKARTGTTLQFEAVRMAACLVASSNFGEAAGRETAARAMKAHTPDRIRKYVDEDPSGERTLYFTTATAADGVNGSGAEAWREVERKWSREVGAALRLAHVQIYERVGILPQAAVYDLVGPLRLSKAEADSLVAYIRRWSILRRCCGAQLSHDYRARLWALDAKYDDGRDAADLPTSQSAPPPPPDEHSHVHPPRRPDDLMYDDCDAYNIERVERDLLASPVAKACYPADRRGGVPVIRLSFGQVEPPLDGTYCARANYATSRFHLVFNDQRYMSIPNSVPLSAVNTHPATRPVWEFPPASSSSSVVTAPPPRTPHQRTSYSDGQSTLLPPVSSGGRETTTAFLRGKRVIIRRRRSRHHHHPSPPP